MCNCLHTIPACDGRTDRQTDIQTSCHGIVRAMYMRRAVKIAIFDLYRFISEMIQDRAIVAVTDC